MKDRKAYYAAYESEHRKERIISKRKRYAANREKLQAEARKYSREHREEQAARTRLYFERNRKKCLAASKLSHRRQQQTELLIIAQRWGDDVPKCRADLTEGLLRVPCIGKLQIDHMNGDKIKERSYRMARVVRGERNLDDLRVLCELHQHCYAILRGDSIGGSDIGEWAE